MKGIFNRYLIAKVVLDFPVLLIAYTTSCLFNTTTSHLTIPVVVHAQFLISSVVGWYLSARISKLNTDRRFNKYAEEIVFITYTILIFFIVQASNIFLFKLFLFYNSAFYLSYIVILYFLELVVKYIARKYLHTFTNKGKIFERVLLISDAPYANHFHDVISKHAFYGFQCIGALHESAEGFTNCPYLGDPSKLATILKMQPLDEVVIAMPKEREKDINEVIAICNQQNLKVRIIPDFLHFTSSPMLIENIGLIPVISQQSLPLDEWVNQLMKRAFDVVFSVLFFVFIATWLFPIVAILVKLSSKGPIFFKQKRWGLNNSHIDVYKFRTMYYNANSVTKDGKFLQTNEHDERVTAIGKFLRKTSIDEFPQFYNVLMGDMSVVGPRPHSIPHSLESLNYVSSYTLRHIIKPGITGWAQVNGYRGITKNHFDMQNRVNYDLYYIRKWDFWLDCQIVLQTIINLLKGDENVY